MRKSRIAVVLSFVVFGLCSARAGEVRQPEQPDELPQWAGAWEMSAEVNRLLGFTDEETRWDASCDHPLSFRLSLDEEFGASLGAERLKAYREIVHERMGHRIVATGKWEMAFDDDPRLEPACFVTDYKGTAYLWVAAPYTLVYGGKVSFIQGVDRDHDVLAIDFNAVPKQLAGEYRTPDTVAYKRVKES